MIELVSELRSIDEALRDTTRYANDLAYQWTIDALLTNIAKVENAWYGSWFGYLANVYCNDFDSPTLEMHGSLNWDSATIPNRESWNDSGWRKYSDAEVDSVIEEGIERRDIRKAFDQSLKWAGRFKDKKADVIAIIKIAQMNHASIFDPLADAVERLRIPTPEEIVESKKQAALETMGPVANQLAIRIPPHIHYRARIKWSMDGASTVRELREVVRQIIAQIERVPASKGVPQKTGNKIFIGHGRDKSWLELKNFIDGKLKLPVTAYEEVTPHGYPVYDNVISRVGEAGMAFLVMTGEDIVTDTDGNEIRHPRLNVVHELGICQAMLPQGRAIALVEKGCKVPSNIVGFDQIRFEKGNIMSASEDIRDVLVREKFHD